MAKELILIMMEEHIQVHGKMERNMEKVNKFGQVVQLMKVIMLKAKEKVMELHTYLKLKQN